MKAYEEDPLQKPKIYDMEIKILSIPLHIMNIMCKDWYSKLYFSTAKNSMKGMPNDGNANIEKFYFSLAIWSRRKPDLHQNHICIIHV